MKNSWMLATDFYELTMAGGYFEAGKTNEIAYFDYFFRSVPDDGGYAIACGQSDVIRYLQDFQFDEDDLAYLRSKHLFSEAFLTYLKTLKFTGDVWGVNEGSVVFPNEPILIIRAPIIEAQLIETYLLLQMNHQSLIATKASRIVRAAQGRTVMEFGARRAHGYDAALSGAKAAYIGGVHGTSLAKADQLFKIPALGTMAHSWVQLFDSEIDAFKAYARTYPHHSTFLVDTYNVLKSGVPNAIETIKEVLLPLGIRKAAIRIDSGDLTYLSKESRKLLDAANMTDVSIVVSNSLDEWLITELLSQGAKIDSFGVGERLITAKSEPVFGGVYKLVAVEKNRTIQPKIKLSENPDKMTNPHFKQVYRIYDPITQKAQADLVTLHDEIIDETLPITIFDPLLPHKKKTFDHYTLEKRMQLLYKNGKPNQIRSSVEEARRLASHELSTLWDEVKRFKNPHGYYVDLSDALWRLRKSMIEAETEE